MSHPPEPSEGKVRNDRGRAAAVVQYLEWPLTLQFSLLRSFLDGAFQCAYNYFSGQTAAIQLFQSITSLNLCFSMRVQLFQCTNGHQTIISEHHVTKSLRPQNF
jgi:hypothetical protein